jgi:hypothetical protein
MDSLCILCDEQGIERPGTIDEFGNGPWCRACFARESEQAWERFCADFYGGSGPVTQREQYQAAAKQKREQR